MKIPWSYLGEKGLLNVVDPWDFLLYCWFCLFFCCWFFSLLLDYSIYFLFPWFIILLLILFVIVFLNYYLSFLHACKLDSPFWNPRPNLSNGDLWISSKLSKASVLFSIFRYFLKDITSPYNLSTSSTLYWYFFLIPSSTLFDSPDLIFKLTLSSLSLASLSSQICNNFSWSLHATD